MSLPDVHVNDPHVNAHNDERHVVNTILDLTNTGRLSDDALTATYARLSGVQTTASASGAVVAGKHNPVDATSGNLTMTLADATDAGQMVVVSKKDATANTVTVSVAHLRDGSAGSIVLVGQYEAITLTSKADGSWWPIGDHKTKAYLDATYSSVFTPVGNTATDTAALQAKINTGGRILVNAGFGVVVLGTIQIKTGAHLDLGGCTLQLAAGTNADLITVPNFGTLTGGTTTTGEQRWSIRNGVLDGNGVNQSGTSWPIRVYAYNYRIDNVEILNGLSGNAFSEWGIGGGTNMEARWSRVNLRNPISNNAVNFDWRGPHDSIITDMAVVANSGAGPSGVTGQVGIQTSGNAGGDAFSNVHVWGFHRYGFVGQHSFLASNCTVEGAYDTNLIMLANNSRFDGRVFGTSGANPNEIGIQIGDATHVNIRNCKIDVTSSGWATGGAFIKWVSTAGTNRVKAEVVLNGASVNSGSAHARDDVAIITLDGANIDVDMERIGHPVRIFAGSNTAFQVGNISYNNNTQKLDLNGKSGSATGGQIRGWADSFNHETFEIDAASGFFRPGTTAALGARIWSGSGAPTTPGGSMTYSLGDAYLRTDTPGTANQRLYLVTTAGTSPTWTGVL